MKRVVIYCRVSTEEEHQLNALERQIEELTDFVSEQEGWVLIDRYIDRGKSGTSSKKRREYMRLFDDLQGDKFDIVVIKDQSRLMRNCLDWCLFVDRLVRNDKRLYFYLRRAYFESTDETLCGIEALLAAQYSKDLSVKILNASHKAQKKGVIYGNSNIYGYVKDKGRLVVNEDEARVVRLIFELYIAGNGFRVIQGMLMEKGIMSSTGTPFSLSTMKRMIRQEKYAGVIVSHKTYTDFNKKTVVQRPESEWVRIYDPKNCPPIVSREVFDRANEILQARCIENGADEGKKRGAFKGNTYTLSGKIKCGKCGATYYHEHYLTAKNKYHRNIWQCGRYKAYGKIRGCYNRKLQDEELLNVIRVLLYNMVNDDDVKAVVGMIADEEKTEKRDYEGDIRRLRAQLERYERRKENLVLSMSDGIITRDEYVVAKKATDADIIRVSTELVGLEQEKGAEGIDKLQGIKDFLKSIDKFEDIDDNVIKDIVDEIVVTDDIIDINLRTGYSKEYSFLKSASVTEDRQIRPHTEIYRKCVNLQFQRALTTFIVHI